MSILHRVEAQPIAIETTHDFEVDAPIAPIITIEGRVPKHEAPIESLHAFAEREMQIATSRFMVEVAVNAEANVMPEARDMEIHLTKTDSGSFTLGNGWEPADVYTYSSTDPYQGNNPGMFQAATALIEATIAVANELKGSEDPMLTYLTSQRSRGGKRATVVTKALINMDKSVGDWITSLPDAERLRPVAHPWQDSGTVICDANGEIAELPNTPALNALVGGAGDGRAVREREAWEKAVLSRLVDLDRLPGGRLVITSLGTGTGEPAVDTGIALTNLRGIGVTVNGFDINPRSLMVADYLVARKQEQHAGGVAIEFVPRTANILSHEGIKEAVAGTDAQIYEAVGFAEYVPSANATDSLEQKQREIMKKMGCLSAEEFYGAIYESMPKGSILMTGNMRDDSPQAAFVTGGLGWKGIIQRSTESYLQILSDAGIPGNAVGLYVPDGEESAGVYNLVAITKL